MSERDNSIVGEFPNEQILYGFRAQLYWSDVPCSFTEQDSAKSWAHLGETPRQLSFTLPPLRRAPREFRLVLTPTVSATRISSLRITSSNGRASWNWDGAWVDLEREGESQETSHVAQFSLLQSQRRVMRLSPRLGSKLFERGAAIEFTISCDLQTKATPANQVRGEGDVASSYAQIAHDLAVTSAALEAVYSSKSWQLTGPLRKLLSLKKALLHKYKGRYKRGAKPRTAKAFEQTAPLRARSKVDVIVPVYKGLAQTTRCLESLMRSTNKTPFELIVVNDCSPEPELAAFVNALAKQGKITLLEHRENLGYTRTINEAICLHNDRDVVLLNSDTEVSGNWLDRVSRAAYSENRVGTVTPFSNNATLCSYPKPFAQNELPTGWTTASLDSLMQSVNANAYVQIPTAVGCCMYITRACLDETGLFDAENFPGYGEENDFCMRASDKGWGHLLAGDTFIHHEGAVSFGTTSRRKQAAALIRLRRIHPEYETIIARYCAKEPAASLRQPIDLERLRRSAKPKILHVLPRINGGTEYHIKDLIAGIGEQCEFLTLLALDDGWSLEWQNDQEAMKVQFERVEGYADLVVLLKSLSIQRAHIHHVRRTESQVRTLVQDLSLPFDFTVHDFYTVCPQISFVDETNQFCGQPDDNSCNRCIAANGPTGATSIQSWRESHRWLLTDAERVFVPSLDAAQRLSRYVDGVPYIITPHPDRHRFGEYAQAHADQLAQNELFRIAVLGALNEPKGVDVVEECAIQAVEEGLPFEFHLVGYGSRPLTKRPRANLIVYGEYNNVELKDILAQVRPHLIWFPARLPESYSYTLSAALEMGVPIAAPNIGSFPERLHDRQWSWIVAWDYSPEQWNRFFKGITENFKSMVPPIPPNVLQPAYSSFSYKKDYLAPLSEASKFKGVRVEQLVR